MITKIRYTWPGFVTLCLAVRKDKGIAYEEIGLENLSSDLCLHKESKIGKAHFALYDDGWRIIGKEK